VLDEATRLSSTHTLTGGHRGFDVLHVAAALVLGAGEFLTKSEKAGRRGRARGSSVGSGDGRDASPRRPSREVGGAIPPCQITSQPISSRVRRV